MSLFQCDNCGCCDSTAPSNSTAVRALSFNFDWSDCPDRRGMSLYTCCAPTRLADGKPSGLGEWHNIFPRVFLPKGKFITNRVGNLEHVETGSEDFMAYQLSKEGV